MVQQLELGADPVPEETQTQIPEATFEDAAATLPEEAAVQEEPAEQVDPRLQGLIEEAARKAATEAAQQAREEARQQYQQEEVSAQRRRQAENAARANDQLVAQAREERAAELLQLEANRLGVVDADLEGMKRTARRLLNEVEPIHRSAALNEAARVVTYLAHQSAGAEPDFALSPREEQMAGAFEQSVNQLIRNPRLRDQIVAEERRKWEMNLNDEIDKRLEARLTERQKAQKPVSRPNGTAASTLDTSDGARLNRIAYGGATPEDQAWFMARYPKFRQPNARS